MCCQQGKANCIKHQCPTSASGPWFQPRCLQEVQTAGTTDRLSTSHQPLDGATNGLSCPQGRLTEPNLTLTFQPTGANAGGGLMDKSRRRFLRSNMGPGLLLCQPGSLQRGKANLSVATSPTQQCFSVTVWATHSRAGYTGLPGVGRLAWRRPAIGNAHRTQTRHPP